MKLLSGSEIAGFVKERQAKQVRGLRQAHGIAPRLAIVQTKDDPVINTYVRLKRRYGEDILIDVDQHMIGQAEAGETIARLNEDEAVHGIIVQLPLADPAGTDEVLAAVAADKDVDGLAPVSEYDPATPKAIMWLLAGYNVDLEGKSVLIVGRGRLVGDPLFKMLSGSGHDVSVATSATKDLAAEVSAADVVVTATGVPGLIKAEWLRSGAVVIDAGVAVDKGEVRGDLDSAAYERDDISATPAKGGVGPLTVAALFDNVIQSSLKRIGR